MPIPRYRLDDRSFDDLVAEMLSRIPGHTPEWTNVQDGDPGRTLIELFAWLGDTILYRANLLPERQRLEFLRLLNVPMRAARAAGGLVSLEVQSERVEQPIDLDRFTAVQGPVDFETGQEITVLPVFGEVYAKRKPTPGERAEIDSMLSGLEDVYGLTSQLDLTEPSASGVSSPYVTTKLFSKGPFDPAGFDFVSDTWDQSLWIALLAATPDPDLKGRVQEAMNPSANGARLLSIGVQPRLTVPEFGEPVHKPLEMRDLWQWSMPSARPDADGDPYRIPYRPLEILEDTTDGFTRAGVVKLALPKLGSPEPEVSVPPNSVEEDRFAGTGNRPPRIDDEDAAGRLVGWVRLSPASPATTLGVTWMGINSVAVDQRRTVQGVIVATSDGSPDQTIALPTSSIERESFALQVEEPERGYVEWNERPLHEAGAYERAFELDDEAGAVRFGDGVRGSVPQVGMRIRVARMRSGGGRQGNVLPGNLSAVSHPQLKLTQPLAMTGGVDAESLDDAERRIPSELRHGHRAVTAEDYEEIARYTKGVDLGRVAVFPKFKPQQRLEGVKGVVSVMVLPQVARRTPPNPRPDRSMLQRVHARLEMRRPLGVELYVIGTEYVPIGLSVAVDIREGSPRNEVLTGVGEALRDHLWPLAPGGHDHEGWPLGQAVVSQQLEVIVARVPGVLTVNDVKLFRRRPDFTWEPIAPGEARSEVALESWQLPELLTIVVDDADTAADTLEPTGPDDPTGGGTGGRPPVPIPVVPESCR